MFYLINTQTSYRTHTAHLMIICRPCVLISRRTSFRTLACGYDQYFPTFLTKSIITLETIRIGAVTLFNCTDTIWKNKKNKNSFGITLSAQKVNKWYKWLACEWIYSSDYNQKDYQLDFSLNQTHNFRSWSYPKIWMLNTHNSWRVTDTDILCLLVREFENSSSRITTLVS